MLNRVNKNGAGQASPARNDSKVYFPGNQPIKTLLFLARFARIVGSTTSPQEQHFQASKERTKS